MPNPECRAPAADAARTLRRMAGRNMRVTFTRRKRGCAWTAERPPRHVVPGPTMASGADLPHDLYTFVIEDALGLRHGFWGCVADGATFATLGRKRTPQGRAIIARHLDDLDAAERQVNDIYFAWKRGEPTALDAELDDALARWRAIEDGESLTLEWPMSPG